MTDNDAPCSECGGDGDEMRKCEPCNGKGRSCDVCDGYGFHIAKGGCPTCGGSGKSPAGRKEILQMTDEPSKANVKITVS